MADQKKEDVSAYVQSTSPLAEANNHLALKLHKVLAKEQTNVFFSPFSISTALAMTFHGARGETAAEMSNVLGYDMAKLSNDKISLSYKQLMEDLKADSKSYTLAVANAIMVHKDFVVNDQYKNDLKNSYEALVTEVDFLKETKAALDDINLFVKDSTNEKIPVLLNDIDPLTVMVLLNAVYFKGSWLNKFESSATKPQLFFNRGTEGNAKEVSMMHIKNSFLFVQDRTFKALQMPYNGDVAMLIMLPNCKNGLLDLEISLKDSFMNELKNSMRKTKVDVSLPKFRMEDSRSFKSTFQDIGMVKMFDQADFAGITDVCDIVVSEIVHKAVLEVNEEGSEAAAATAVLFRKNCAIISRVPDPEFTVDHPFIFFIYDTRNNFILFSGRIEEL